MISHQYNINLNC